MSSKPSTGESLLPDYVMHFIEYSMLAAAYYFALNPLVADKKRLFLFCVLATSLYGLSDEFHQSFVPTRTPDVKDWAVDTLAGFVVAALLIYSRATPSPHARRG